MNREAKAFIGEVCTFQNGGTPTTTLERYFHGDIPWITGADITSPIVTNARSHITKEAVENSATNCVPAGTVLLVTRTSVGKVAVAGVDLCFSQDITALTPDPARLYGPYLVEYLRTKQTYFERHARGATIKGVTQRVVADLEIPLPPLAEQKRIACLLDRADGLRAKRRAALARLDTLVESIFLDMFGEWTTSPKKWPEATLGDVAAFVGGGTPSRARPDYFAGSICWATSKDMKGEFLDRTEEHITESGVADSATKLVPSGTILVVVKSKILAHHLPVAVTRVPCCFGQDLKGIRVGDRCEVAFVATALRVGKRLLLERARGINTEGLTLDHLRRFPLLIPPLSLQREFTRRAAQVEKIKAAYRASLTEMDSLFTSLQHRAFRGELWNETVIRQASGHRCSTNW